MNHHENGDSSFQALGKLNLKQLTTRFFGQVPNEVEDGHEYYREIARCIRKQGQPGIDFLLKQLGQTRNPDQQAAMLYELSFYQALNETQLVEQKLSGFLSRSLDAKSPKVIVAAIEGLNLIEQSDQLEHIIALLAHPSPDVRGSALRYLNCLHPAEEVEFDLLIKCFQEDGPEGDEAYYHYDAAALIRVHEQQGVDFLLDYFGRASKIVQKRAIIFALTPNAYGELSFQPVNQELLLNLLFTSLNAEEPIIVADAIDGLRYWRESSVWDRILSFIEHPSPYVQGSVLRFASALYQNKHSLC